MSPACRAIADRRHDKHASATAFISKGRSAVTLFLAAGTDYRLQPPDYRGGDPEATAAAQLAEATKESYQDLRDRHVAELSETLSTRQARSGLKSMKQTDVPTDERLQALRKGATDPRSDRSLFPVRALSADQQLAAGQPAGQFAGHLGRRRADAVERRLPHRTSTSR